MIQKFLKNSSKGMHIFFKWMKTWCCYKKNYTVIQIMGNDIFFGFQNSALHFGLIIVGNFRNAAQILR